MKAKWVAVLLTAAVSMPSWGQSQERFALTTQQVARALSDGGIQTAAETVELPARVVATEPNPVLDILSVELLGNRLSGEHSGIHKWVRLACHLPGKCLPFYVVVSSPGEIFGRPTNGSSDSPLIRNDVLHTSTPITMRSGTYATMVMDDGRSHIQVAVISLENGIVGHRIRVTSPDHKAVYVAEVVNAGLLRRNF